MIKHILYYPLIALSLLSCKLNKKINPTSEFRIVDTQMGEVKTDPEPAVEPTAKDTSEFLAFWDRFYRYYIQNDTSNLVRLAFDSVTYPVYIAEYRQFQSETKYVSITDFVNDPHREPPDLVFVPYPEKKQFHINFRYEYNTDTQNLGLKKDSILLKYFIRLRSKQISGNYEINRIHAFSFVRMNNHIKFAGLQIVGESTDFRNDSTTRSHLYFPLYRETQDSLTNRIALDTFLNLWYSNVLAGFNEPRLYNYEGEDEVYRFTWLRSFHNPVVIRFQKHGTEYSLITKEMIDRDGYMPDTIIINTTQNLSGYKWDKLVFKLGRIGFWNMATRDPEPRPMDGAEWILEAYVKGKYHFTTRTVAKPDYKDCCKYLLFLSKLKIPEEDIY